MRLFSAEFKDLLEHACHCAPHAYELATVLLFAGAMHERLKAKAAVNDADGTVGWMRDGCSFDHLLTQMAVHCGQINELIRVFVNSNGKEKFVVAETDIAELVKQCADCDNFAMMIADRAQRRRKRSISSAIGSGSCFSPSAQPHHK